MGNVWKMGQGVWNYSTIVCFAMQVIISNERIITNASITIKFLHIERYNNKSLSKIANYLEYSNKISIVFGIFTVPVLVRPVGSYFVYFPFRSEYDISRSVTK